MNISVPIKTTKEKFFLEYVSLMKPYYEAFLTKDKKEEVRLPQLNQLKVIAYLMYYNYQFRDMEEDVRWVYIFDTEMRMRLRYKTGMNSAVFDNTVHSLKDKGVFEEFMYDGKKRKRLKKFFDLTPDNQVNVVFSFYIEETKGRP